MENTLKELEEILKKVTGQDYHLKMEDRIREDLELNSISMICIVMGLEKTYNLFLRNLAFENFKTVGDVVDYIEKNKGI